MNFTPFYNAFDVKEGDKMYKPESETDCCLVMDEDLKVSPAELLFGGASYFNFGFASGSH
jgi:hypothetical protein